MKFRMIVLNILLGIGSSLSGIILESDDIRTTLHHVYDTHHHKEIVVIFDIDNTIGFVADGFCGDEWFRAMMAQKLQEGTPINIALNDILPTYFFVQHQIWLEPVQPEVSRMISFLQEIGVATMALTSRSFPIMHRTIEQLDHMEIDFSKTALCPDKVDLTMQTIPGYTNYYDAHYLHGVIFSGENNKGTLLLKFFDHIQYRPQKVIFIDDKIKYVEQVGAAVEQAGISYIGIRYSRLDYKAQEYKLSDYTKQYESIQAIMNKTH